MSISITPIGIVHSPFEGPEGMPIQAAFSDAVGRVSYRLVLQESWTVPLQTRADDRMR